MTVVVIVVVALLLVAAAVMIVGRRRPADGVSSFQRQIDALSPEARRTVVDQVHHVQETGPGDDGEHEEDDGSEEDDDGP